jgi:prephenate dehydrogenase
MNVAIVGAGLIGTSVALAARRGNPDTHVVTLDRGDSLGALASADLVVLATPVDVILDLLHSTRELRDLVVTDVGSTKRAIVAAARETGLIHFVGGHPMAGAATTGPAAARADLFDDRPWFLVPHGAPPQAVGRVRDFVTTLGARPVIFDDDGSVHDQVSAALSHVPQVAATVLMKVIGEAVGADGMQWAGQGCRDMTRLAASPPSVWEAILATNRDEVRPLLRQVADELTAIADRLDDTETVRRVFDAARAHRRALDFARRNESSRYRR